MPGVYLSFTISTVLHIRAIRADVNFGNVKENAVRVRLNEL